MGIFDIYLLEALINGVLLGGVLALLSLGLNLIFGVIDVVWICYAELDHARHVRDVLPRTASTTLPIVAGGGRSASPASASSACSCTCS